MFKQKRIVNGNEYFYLDHSFRIGKTVKKMSIYLHQDLTLSSFDQINQKQISKIARLRAQYIKENQEISPFFRMGNQIEKIEYIKAKFQVIYNLVEDKESIDNKFIRTFLVDNMVMEHSTIDYETAEAIDTNGKIKNKNVIEQDISLYKNIKEAYNMLNKKWVRNPKNIKDLHKIIYKDLFVFAGKFRTTYASFGPLSNRAKTSKPENILTDMKKSISTYHSSKKEVYEFDRIIRFHIDYQGVHGFKDGNSRLGRLIMMDQLLKAGYPAILFKPTQSKSYRTSLVKAINDKNYTAFLKLSYNSYKKTFIEFWLPEIEKNLSKILKK
ncbi:MAG: Fic family protein [Nanoarchaeota archaeon]|nr:Fic family protein [Nanoarchaeota archaeon]